ncbi:alpha/beta hydrolase [Hyunsoonleella pacifica]|uniref:Alpha/beta hydrolase n=1 Tax=Hyunsoonleella pacifica TaxID=1080224 RepID=A0A4Q9FSK0_9FLAO|nr:alpha/beta hydrolase [Hyunsoonleella pacifica]TBN17836.1 alpha/beta hydrolase [Hyunsoonleella pacifica]GGD08536.1 lipase [Hyunsoonleella pacifica]
MRIEKYTFVVLFIVSLFFGCSNETADVEETSNDTLDTSKVYEELNISYGSHERQKFDLYLPANRTSVTKTIILIHGGGWTSGDKGDMDAIKLLINQELPDVAIVNMNYRLADANNPPYPMQIDDISSLVAFLKVNKDRYSISEDIGFVGTSAGAHLSLLWSYAFDNDAKVDMVCSIVGPTNFTDPAYLNNTNPVLQDLLNVFGIDTTTDFLEEVSPLFQVKASSPPTILFYGGQDPLIPTTQGTDLRDKLEALGVSFEFTLYENAGHGWTGLELLDTWSKLKLFIETYL